MNPPAPYPPTDPSEHPSLAKRYVSGETLLLSAICMADLLTTLYWVGQGQAREGNPLMAHFLHLGPGAFIWAKVVTFAPALALAEWYRPRNPQLIRRVLQLVIVGYLAAYVLGVMAHPGNPIERLLQTVSG